MAPVQLSRKTKEQTKSVGKQNKATIIIGTIQRTQEEVRKTEDGQVGLVTISQSCVEISSLLQLLLLLLLSCSLLLLCVWYV